MNNIQGKQNMSTAHPLSHHNFELKHSTYTTDEKIRGRAPHILFPPLPKIWGMADTEREHILNYCSPRRPRTNISAEKRRQLHTILCAYTESLY